MRKAILATLLLALPRPALCDERKDAEATLQKWQGKLNMADWNIEIQVISFDYLQALCPVQCLAGSHFDPESKTGIIAIVRRKDYTDEMMHRWGISNAKADQRDSVVHELLHCVVEYMYPEAAVRTLTAVLKP